MKAIFYYTNGKTYIERNISINPETLEDGEYFEFQKSLDDGRLDGFSEVKIYKDELAAIELITENGRSVFTYKPAVSTKIVVTGYGH